MPLRAFAWGTEGHQVIANLAQAQLTPKARKEVARLLALEPVQTMASISTWADEHRNPNSAAWHYVNFPRDSCTYDAERDCPDGRCVVGAIERQLEVFASNAPDEKRQTALKYVIHLVGDVHQPLHAGYRDDKGGNTYQLQAFMRGSNLHALWDSGLIRFLNEDVESITEKLRRLNLPTETRDLNIARVAEESCRIVALPGFYPQRLVGLDYMERFTPTLEQRLVQAGARLAGLINRAVR
ncbi:MAG: S1/P1 nuclease [Burkholderiaceae bacterium]|nr:S1/P1 nuclease [Burkholderiaceae bacterium]